MSRLPLRISALLLSFTLGLPGSASALRMRGADAPHVQRALLAGLEENPLLQFPFVNLITTPTEFGYDVNALYLLSEPIAGGELVELLQMQRENNYFGFYVGGKPQLGLQAGDDESVETYSLMKNLKPVEGKIGFPFSAHTHDEPLPWPSPNDYGNDGTTFIGIALPHPSEMLNAEREFIISRSTGLVIEMGRGKPIKQLPFQRQGDDPDQARLLIWREGVTTPAVEVLPVKGHFAFYKSDGRVKQIHRFYKTFAESDVVWVMMVDQHGHWVRVHKDVTVEAVFRDWLEPDDAGAILLAGQGSVQALPEGVGTLIATQAESSGQAGTDIQNLTPASQFLVEGGTSFSGDSFRWVGPNWEVPSAYAYTSQTFNPRSGVTWQLEFIFRTVDTEGIPVQVILSSNQPFQPGDIEGLRQALRVSVHRLDTNQIVPLSQWTSVEGVVGSEHGYSAVRAEAYLKGMKGFASESRIRFVVEMGQAADRNVTLDSAATPVDGTLSVASQRKALPPPDNAGLEENVAIAASEQITSQEIVLERVAKQQFSSRFGQDSRFPTNMSGAWLVPADAGTTAVYVHIVHETLLSSVSQWIQEEVDALPEGFEVHTHLLRPDGSIPLETPGVAVKDRFLELPEFWRDTLSKIMPVLEHQLGQRLPSLAEVVLYAIQGADGRMEKVLGVMRLEDSRGRAVYAFFV